ncbi:sirtuin 6 [Rhynchophorus ferrugineus]|uniref:protein acetyllysine N-acetyltransferase n=1 Tax=Rhynchophorus ferrugineus TaxID=354439 RepID=A0A834I6A6_RHYFE|nr:hypothetical protein GWI33_012548 [Rhynchophorus ferrugineus]
MSCNYADGLSPYENKGVLGAPESFDSREDVERKCLILTDWIKTAKHVVVHTGAGISTAAGIPDFRGPKGVWTLEKEGKKPDINISFNDAVPTKTHMALKHLIDKQIIHYIVSQNIDGLHLKTGVPRSHLAELHGNMFIGQCDTCDCQFVMPTATCTVGQKELGHFCKREVRGRSCRGKLKDTILDWEADLPEKDLEMSDYQSSIADVNICLGTTLQIVPSGNLPLKCQKYGGKLVIINLQPTKHDKKADLIINTYVDDVLELLMANLNLEIPEYCSEQDPTKHQKPLDVVNWDILKVDIQEFKKRYEELHKEFKDKKALQKKIQVPKKRVKKNENRKELSDITLKKKPRLSRTINTRNQKSNKKISTKKCGDSESDEECFNTTRSK